MFAVNDADPRELLLLKSRFINHLFAVYKVLRGQVAERARDLLREICVAREVRIVRGAVSPDHVHMLVISSPQLTLANLVQFLMAVVADVAAGRPTPAQAVLA